MSGSEAGQGCSCRSAIDRDTAGNSRKSGRSEAGAPDTQCRASPGRNGTKISNRVSAALLLADLARALAKAPIHAYRWTLKPVIGMECRHLPTCSEYALSAIDRNGAWRGLWLTLSRIVRCRPGGTSGFDPPPDISRAHHPLAPWRYGRWR